MYFPADVSLITIIVNFGESASAYAGAEEITARSAAQACNRFIDGLVNVIFLISLLLGFCVRVTAVVPLIAQ